MVDREPLPEAEILRLADRYRIRLDTLFAAGTFGAKEGRESGASVEIQDFRDYVPGDDPRRIDWFSYGRTGDLIVRLYREEVSPFFDVIVDASASMAVEDGRKGPLAMELCRWLFHSSLASGVSVRLFSAGLGLQRTEEPSLLEFNAPESVLFTSPRRAVAGLRRSSFRLVLSDFMSPFGAAATLDALAAGCNRLIVILLLGPWEAAPRAEGPAVLESVEDGGRADITLDGKAVQAYARRLAAMKDEVREGTIKRGGLYLEIEAGGGLEDVLKERFLPFGLVEIV